MNRERSTSRTRRKPTDERRVEIIDAATRVLALGESDDRRPRSRMPRKVATTLSATR